MAVVITSEQTIPIDEPFKVSAGPGAGKTHWLISHIKSVASNSRKLDVVKKIACITYTNVGTDTIVSRLGIGNDVVDVCTIHSFLFANVVKPYLHLVADEYGIKQEDLAVIDDSNYMTEGVAIQVLYGIKKQWLNGLEGAYWHYDNHQFTEYKPKYPQSYSTKKGKRYVGNALYKEFKTWLWSKGFMSFEDILYMSFILLSCYPNIYNLIKAKYTYVGDKAQSIYDFLGATVQQFDRFTVPEMEEYEIRGNRRSTKQIIELLNVIRTDFAQDWLNGTEGMKPILLVGDMLDCYQKSIEISGSDEIQSLAFPNILANSMRRKNGARDVEMILEMDFDSNPNRQLYVKTLLKAVEYTKMNDLRNAWHQLDIIDRDRTKTIVMLRLLLDGYNLYKDGTLMDFFHILVTKLQLNLQGFRAGTPNKTFYETHSYADAALGVKGGDSDDKHKTIHKSKGEEFDNVFVILQDENDLGFLVAPSLYNNNVHRVYYVAASRAKQRLFINVPNISNENRVKLEGIPSLEIS